MHSNSSTRRSENNSVHVRFWGVRGSIPSPEPGNMRYGGNTSCVEIRVGRQILILDAGSGIRRLGRALAAEFGDEAIDATLLISHTHWDHIQGLPFFQAAYSAANRIRILGATGTGSRLRTAFKNQMASIHFPVPLSHLGALEPVDELPSEESQIGHVRVRTTALNHPGGCTGFRLEASGVSVAYLPDHEPYRTEVAGRVNGTFADADAQQKDAALVTFLRDCDLLILDSQYDREEYPTRAGWGHGCLEESVDLAIRAGARNLALFHHDPEHDDLKLDAMLARARQLASARGSKLQVRAAREGDSLHVRENQRLAA